MFVIPALTMLLASVPDTAGIYLSAEDFQQHRLSYLVPDDQLQYDSPFRPWALMLHTADGKRLRFLADSIYGFRKGANTYRFVSGNSKGDARIDDGFYKIEATTPCYIYSYRYVFSATQLLFSLTPTGPVTSLNTKNLAKYFPNKPAMLQAVGQDGKLKFSMATRDEDGQLRVAKILARFLP